MAYNKRLNGYKVFKECEERDWKGAFYFVVGADCQFGLQERYVEKKDPYGWEIEKAKARMCVEKINNLKPKPKFFVICGDLVDAQPEWKEREQQEVDFWEIFSQIDPSIPLVCVCGNHDVGNQPTVSAVNRYRSVFGNDYMSFWVGGTLFLVINSQYFFDGSQVEEIAKEQEEWLDKQLEQSTKSRLGAIIFQHIPWFIDDVEDKEEAYFAIPYQTRIRMLDKLDKAGVRYILTGHLHRNNYSVYKNIECITTSAIGAPLGDDPSGFRIVRICEDKLLHKYYTFQEVPDKITL